MQSNSETTAVDVDVVIFGTSLRESVLAAALSKAGFTVAHLDHNGYYGGDDSSLSLDELRQWADERKDSTHESIYLSSQHTRFTAISTSSTSPSVNSRQFSISLSPTIVPSVGPLVDALVASGASRYGGFKLLERVALYDKPGFVTTVPGSKEDVFKSSELTLLDKRRLMRFLMFAASDFEAKPELIGHEKTPFLGYLRQIFSLNEAASEAVVYALAFCATAADATLPALQRIRRYLRSAGRYGASPFLVGHYGGIGEVAQGFCRVSAVHGGIYILGRDVSSINVAPEVGAVPSNTQPQRRFSLRLENFPEQLNCDMVISTDDYLETQFRSQTTHLGTRRSSETSNSVARCIAIIDHPILFLDDHRATTASLETEDANLSQENTSGQVDTALLIFPPNKVDGGSADTAVTALISGEAALAAPKDYWIVHLSMPLTVPTSRSAEDILKPYLHATLSLAALRQQGSAPIRQQLQPLYSVFYIEHPSSSTQPQSDAPSSTSSPYIFIPPPNTAMVSELADAAVTNAETTFWKVVATLKEIRRNRRAESTGRQAGGEDEIEIENFWPPISDTSVVDQDW